MRRLALLALLLLPANAEAAVPFGVGDDGAVINQPELLTQARDDLAAKWVRFQVVRGDEAEYDNVIRHADRNGYRIMINYRDQRGGSLRKFPARTQAMLRRWPSVDAVGVLNEPEFTRSPSPCEYLKLYSRTRKAVRSVKRIKVLFGEFSPSAWSYIAEFNQCRRIPRKIDGIAVHPYMQGDPLAPNGGWRERKFTKSDAWMGIGNLPQFRRIFRQMGLKAPFYITEFGYLHEYVTDQDAATWWPRAFKQAKKVGAKVLIAHGAWSYGRHRDWNSPIGRRTHQSIATRTR